MARVTRKTAPQDNQSELDAAFSNLKEVRGQLNSVFLEREAAIDGILAALLAQEPTGVFLLGPTGTGKTALANAIAKCFADMSTGYQLFGAQSTLEDAVGATDILALRNGSFRRNLEGGVAGVDIFLADEVFKGNAAVLNAQLGPMADGVYRNGDEGVIECPLSLYIGMSNEIPEEDGLAAFFDRLEVRYLIDYVSPSSRAKLMEWAAKRSWPKITATLSRNDIQSLRAATETVKIEKEALRELNLLITQARERMGITFSDRRAIRAIGLLKAYALVLGDLVVEEDHLRFFSAMCWDSPDQIEAALELTGRLNSRWPAALKAIEDGCGDWKATLSEVGKKLNGSDERERLAAQTSLFTAMGQVRDMRNRLGRFPARWTTKNQAEFDRVEAVVNALDRKLGEISALPQLDLPI